MLEAIAVVGGDMDPGMQREAVHLRTQRPRNESRSPTDTESTHSPEPRTCFGTLGDATLDGCGLQQREQALVLLFLPHRDCAFVSHVATPAQQAQDAVANRLDELLDVLVAELARFIEDGSAVEEADE